MKNNKHDGFSLIEAIIAIGIISLIGIVAVMGVFQALRGFDKAQNTLITCARIIQVKNFLEKVTAGILFPFWLSRIDTEQQQSLKIPYLDAEEENYIQLSFTGNYLIIELHYEKEDNDQVFSFGPFSDVSFELLSADLKPFYGIKILITPLDRGFDMVEILAEFGCYPFWSTAGNL
jgi:hypothetical protein